MAKYCPRCGLVYGDAATYCDQEGTQLITAREPITTGRKSSRWKSWGITLGIVSITLLVIFFAAVAHIRGAIEVTLEDISIAQRSQEDSGLLPGLVDRVAGVARALAGKGDFSARVKVRNNTSLPGQVSSARYVVFVNDEQVGTGNWPETGSPVVAIRSGEEVSLELPLRIDPKSAFASALDALSSQELPYRIEGYISISVAMLNIDVPFKVTRVKVDVPVGKPQSF